MDVTSVLNSIKTAADALEEKPRLESRISELSREVDSLAAHNAGLESNIINYKSTIDSLNEKVRSLEVERDQAQFRTLELEDAHSNLARTLRSIGVDIGNAVLAIDPPKPEPVPEPVAIADAPVSVGQPAQEWSGSPDPQSPDTHWLNDATGQRVPASPAPSAPTPETPTLKYTGLTWSQAREKYGNVGPDAVTYVQSVWLENGGTMENWHK